MVLDRNPENFFAEVEQAELQPVEPRARAPACRPDRMLMGAHLHLPRHAPAPDRPQLRAAADQPPAVPRALLQQGRADDLPPRGRPAGLRAELLRRPGGRPGAAAPRSAGTSTRPSSAARPTSKHADDDDFGQPGTLVREVMDDAEREALVDNIVGTPPTRSRRRCSCGSSPTGRASTSRSARRVADGPGARQRVLADAGAARGAGARRRPRRHRLTAARGGRRALRVGGGRVVGVDPLDGAGWRSRSRRPPSGASRSRWRSPSGR